MNDVELNVNISRMAIEQVLSSKNFFESVYSTVELLWKMPLLSMD